MSGKLMTMREAIATHVKPGDTLFLSGALNGEPSAALHEIARQRIGNLTITCVLVFLGLEILISEGLVDNVLTAYLNQDEKMNYPLARARQRGKFPAIHETSHHGIALSLLAGQMNVPFLPTQALLGSDIVARNDRLGTVKCPFSGVNLTAIRAVTPDVAILQCQRADVEGNAQKWGTLGVDIEGLGASKKVIVVAEEIVDSDVIRREPNLTVVPSFRTTAVVHQPWGGYPQPLAGYYNSDIRQVMRETRSSADAFDTYLGEYVYGVSDWNEYLEKRKGFKGEDYLEKLKIKEPIFSIPTVTGY